MQIETNKKAGVAILISDKINLEIKAVKRDKVIDFIFWGSRITADCSYEIKRCLLLEGKVMTKT